MIKYIKIGHIADCHIRQAQYGDSKRGYKFVEAVIDAAKKAKENNVKVIMCPGDLLDSNNPGTVVVNKYLPELHSALKKLNVTLIVCEGNHDNCKPSWMSPYKTLSNVIDISDRSGGIVFVEGLFTLNIKIEEGITQVMTGYALGFTGTKEDTVLAFQKVKEHGAVHFILWHGELKELCKFPSEGSISITDIPDNSCLCNVFMGHIHDKGEIIAQDGTLFIYPGSTEMCAEDEDINKYMAIYSYSVLNNVVELESHYYVRLDTQPVLFMTIETEENLNNLKQYFMKNSSVLAYIRYNTKLLDIVRHIQTIADSASTIRLVPIVSSKYNIKSLSRDTVVKGPVTFFKENADAFIPDVDVLNRVESLCVNLLTDSIDSKVTIETYCSKRLGNISV